MAYLSDLRKILGSTYDFGTNDTIVGTANGDTINVYGGSDLVVAGAGNDYIFDVRAYNGGNSGNDWILAGNGDDTIVSSLDSVNTYEGGDGTDTLNLIPNTNGVFVDLATGVARDRATLKQSTISTFENVTGSGQTDYLYGNAGANRLVGYNGDDLIRGQDGIDTLYGDRGQDVLFGGNQNDTVYGGEGNDMLYGDNGGDMLFGEAGTDYLIGGAGRDYLSGGTGADTFKFNVVTESGTTGATADMIADFVHLSDKINVADIDARATAAGNQAFTFIGNNNFSAAGQIRYVLDAGSQDTVILFNTDNDAAAEMVIKIDPLVALSAGDFIL
ncbi:MAG: calcium-binding protein [Hyphomicrobium sp.]